MNMKCPICQSTVSEHEAWVRSQDSTPCDHYSCPRCGDFSVKFGDEKFIPVDSPEKVAVLSHWVRSKHENNIRDEERSEIVLDRELIKSIIKNPPPNPAEQANKFILWLGNSKNPPGELILVQPLTHQSIMGSITPKGFQLVLYHLMDNGILKGIKAGDMQEPARANVALSVEGWEYYEKLKRGAIESRKAFMAMKYGDEQLDQIVDDIFKPAVKQTGFDLFKLPDRPQPAGLIDDRIRVEIQTSRFLIADLTHENRGAYWEAGYAEGLGKPVIYTCEKEKFEKLTTHFDTNHHLTILWDAENPKESAEKLKVTIRATLPGEAKLTDD
jgi:hypothetical protein